MTSTIKVNNLQNQCGANTINKCGTAITVGASGDTVTLAAGASQSGFGQTYSAVSWDTTPKTTTITGAAGVGYFVNTSGGAVTANLPAGTAGDVIAFADYAATWQTNNLTVSPNGTDKMGGLNASVTLDTQGQSVTFVYVDSTQGWINTMDSTSNVRGAAFICASVSGACKTLAIVDTNYKVATFTGPGTFTVNSGGGALAVVDYAVVAGGGAGGSFCGGGGGAGGYRESHVNATSGPYTASPLAATSSLPVSIQGYPIDVGGGGPGSTCTSPVGNPGTNSTFSTIVSAGGGGGGRCNTTCSAASGGSGGGGAGSGPGAANLPGGAGNTPAVSPPQGNTGGTGSARSAPFPTNDEAGGGGGGATAVGANASTGTGGAGGAGATSSINTTPTARGGGGGGGSADNPGGAGGTGGGGTGGDDPSTAGTPGTINTGGGGGGAGGNAPAVPSGNGGSGIVIIRYKFQ